MLIRFVVIGLLASAALPTDASDPRKDAFIDALLQREKLVRSIAASATMRRFPTDPEDHDLVRQLMQRKGRGDRADRAIYTQEDCERASFHLRWWAKGRKRRSESLDIRRSADASEPPREVTAFDGVLVRQIGDTHDRRRGSINTFEGAHWNGSQHADSLDLLFRWHTRPFSEIITNSSEVAIEDVDQPAGAFKLLCTYPIGKSSKYQINFTVDPDYSIKRVDIITQKHEPAPRLWESWEYFDYRDVRDSSGEQLAIPHRVNVKFYLGELPSGEPLSNMREEYTISAIDLNPDLPDDLFTLAFPEGMPVWDGVNGYGWTNNKQAASVQAFTPEATRALPPWQIVVTAMASIGAAGGIALWLRRRKRALGPVT